MPTNVFFNQAVKSEQNLVEDLVVESLRMYGHNCYYLPRTIVNEDTILGEATNSTFDDAYEVEMYLDGNEGFEGEGDLYSKFGVEVRDSATFTISRRTWERFVSLDVNLATGLRPNEGDLIYFPLGKKLFEIGFVDHDDPFYQLANLPVYKLRCRTFDYSHEDMATGISEIDDIETAQSLDALAYQVTLESGTESGTNYLLTEAGDWIVSEEYSVDTIDSSSDSDYFETQGDSILDFSEMNPFGEVT